MCQEGLPSFWAIVDMIKLCLRAQRKSRCKRRGSSTEDNVNKPEVPDGPQRLTSSIVRLGPSLASFTIKLVGIICPKGRVMRAK